VAMSPMICLIRFILISSRSGEDLLSKFFTSSIIWDGAQGGTQGYEHPGGGGY
jgi:hypothetical protein